MSNKNADKDESTRKSTSRQALYRKYRSKSFDDVVGQKHITDTLKRAIKTGRINHAYLFTGPKGVGKTSVARILAHEVNDLDYKDESEHLDIIEIDGASNRRIDEIRDLRDKVHISPASAKYKVYIIDEVHMLTREAFNALLKTLEEPPAHCIFILATTEAHKLPATIVSRTQRFEFKPIGQKFAVERLAQIAKSEKIAVEPAALTLLAEHGDGSFRDSIGLLDQLSSDEDKITEAKVRDFLGLPPKEALQSILDLIEQGDAAALLAAFEDLRGQGMGAAAIAKGLSKTLREAMIAGSYRGWAADLLTKLIEVPASYDAEASLEICLLEACLANQPADQPPSQPPEHVPAMPEAALTQETVVEEIAAKPEPKATVKPRHPRGLDTESWEQILDEVKAQAASLYTALRLAEPGIENDALVLSFQFPLHQKKLDQAKNKALVADVAKSVLGKDLSVQAVVSETKPTKPAPAPRRQVDPAQVQTISNIFGQAEVLES